MIEGPNDRRTEPHSITPSSANLTGTGDPQLIDGANVTPYQTRPEKDTTIKAELAELTDQSFSACSAGSALIVVDAHYG